MVSILIFSPFLPLSSLYVSLYFPLGGPGSLLVVGDHELQYFRFDSRSFEIPFNYNNPPFDYIGGVIVETGNTSVVIDSEYIYTAGFFTSTV